MIILGIESSCDDTAAAILQDEHTLLANVVSGQDIIHARFGGVVPELASRRHMEMVSVVVDMAIRESELQLTDIDLISVTRGPGLIGSLLVGFSYAKSLAYTLNRPFIGVDHMAGHLLSAFLEVDKPSFPYLALIVSGGTTALFRVDDYFTFSLLGRTRDDAAGEAFDKVARLLNLGYPGGPAVSRAAIAGDANRFLLPRAWLEEGSHDFSFSGLKTAVLNQCKLAPANDERFIGDICTSFQQAVIDVLIEKTIVAAHRYSIPTIVLGGGVTANTELRQQFKRRCKKENLLLHLPAVENCTDNAAMIAFTGLKMFAAGQRGKWTDDVYSRSPLGR